MISAEAEIHVTKETSAILERKRFLIICFVSIIGTLFPFIGFLKEVRNFIKTRITLNKKKKKINHTIILLSYREKNVQCNISQDNQRGKVFIFEESKKSHPNISDDVLKSLRSYYSSAN